MGTSGWICDPVGCYPGASNSSHGIPSPSLTTIAFSQTTTSLGRRLSQNNFRGQTSHPPSSFSSATLEHEQRPGNRRSRSFTAVADALQQPIPEEETLRNEGDELDQKSRAPRRSASEHHTPRLNGKVPLAPIPGSSPEATPTDSHFATANESSSPGSPTAGSDLRTSISSRKYSGHNVFKRQNQSLQAAVELIVPRGQDIPSPKRSPPARPTSSSSQDIPGAEPDGSPSTPSPPKGKSRVTSKLSVPHHFFPMASAPASPTSPKTSTPIAGAAATDDRDQSPGSVLRWRPRAESMTTPENRGTKNGNAIPPSPKRPIPDLPRQRKDTIKEKEIGTPILDQGEFLYIRLRSVLDLTPRANLYRYG